MSYYEKPLLRMLLDKADGQIGDVNPPEQRRAGSVWNCRCQPPLSLCPAQVSIHQAWPNNIFRNLRSLTRVSVCVDLDMGQQVVNNNEYFTSEITDGEQIACLRKIIRLSRAEAIHSI